MPCLEAFGKNLFACLSAFVWRPEQNGYRSASLVESVESRPCRQGGIQMRKHDTSPFEEVAFLTKTSPKAATKTCEGAVTSQLPKYHGQTKARFGGEVFFASKVPSGLAGYILDFRGIVQHVQRS